MEHGILNALAVHGCLSDPNSSFTSRLLQERIKLILVSGSQGLCVTPTLKSSKNPGGFMLYKVLREGLQSSDCSDTTDAFTRRACMFLIDRERWAPATFNACQCQRSSSLGLAHLSHKSYSSEVPATQLKDNRVTILILWNLPNPTFFLSQKGCSMKLHSSLPTSTSQIQSFISSSPTPLQ